MAEPTWPDVRRLLERCLDLPQDQRAAFLDAECADPALRREVEALLAAHTRPVAWLDRPPSEPPATAGHRIGKYTVIREIGRGGMGAVVWLAHDEVFGREVALKVVAETATSPQELERFERESKSAGKLTHPHIVKIYEEGRTDHSRFFAMEYVAGHDLAEEIRRQAENGRSRPILPPFAQSKYIPAVAALCADAAEALHHAHAAGIIHRDVKPRNLLLDREGRVFVADFGLARDSRFGSISQSEAILGTPYYMSPEQARVLDAGVIDNRTDVYSLGVVLYELLTLERPFDGRTRDEVRARIQREEAKPVQRVNRRVPADLAAICHGAMSKGLSTRYRTAGEMAQDLRRFLAHEGIVFRPPPWWRRAAGRVYRHRLALATVAAFVAFGLAVGWWVKHDSARQRLAETMAGLESLDPAALEMAPTPQLAAGYQALRSLEAAGYVGTEQDAAHLAALRQAYLELEQRMISEGRALSADPAAGAGQQWLSADDERILRGIMRLQNAALIFARPGLAQAVPANPFAPRLTVRVRDESERAMAGTVGYRMLDPVTGQADALVELGSLPVVMLAVPYGYLRLVATVDGAGVREFSRYFSRGDVETVIEHVVRSVDQSVAGMVAIDGGVLELHDAECPLSGINHRRLTIEPFLLDRYEVSNADYRRFLKVHPQVDPPAYWSQVAEGSPEDSLPVTMISWFEARAFAEWLGKRLPTHAEWAFAARGPEGRRFPWPNAVAGEYRGNTRQPLESALTLDRQIDAYLRRAQAVASHPDAATSSGLFHMLGNVAEWTESLAPEIHGGVFQPRFHTRIAIGDAWYAANWPAPRGDLTTISMCGPEKSHASHRIGFRCAKSR
ncbi:MAG TPA: bifunctional serine/threonine-protein kinase/formylglycine-generating enzyme family protein [Planctomycetota bacterium]